MIKYDLVRGVQEKAGLSHTEATKAVDQAISIMKETLADGETVKLTGFGTFLVRKRAERKGRNLTTGEEIPVQAKWKVTFKACDDLKAMVNNDKGGI